MGKTLNKWEKVFDAEIEYDNAANDYYFEWYDLKGELSLNDIFERYFGETTKVIVKVKKGALFIVKRKESS